MSFFFSVPVFILGCSVGKPESSMEPAVEEPASEPSSEGSTEPTTEPSTEPSTEPTTEPSTEPSQPSNEPQRPSNSPINTGSYSVNVENTTVSLSTTDIGLHTYYPVASGQFPIVVFHHGFQLSAENYLSYGEHLASWGFVVVMPSISNEIWDPYTHAELGVISSEVVDYLSTSTLISQSGDVEKIALAGHSLGGKIAMYHASFDDRIDAVFGIDPVDSAGGPFNSVGEDYPSVTPELMGDISIPIGLVGELTNATCSGFCEPCAPEEENFEQYYTHATSSAIQIEMIGANHMSFLDDPDCGFSCDLCTVGTDDPELSRKLTQKYMVAFLYHTLMNSSQFDAFLFGDWMEEDNEDGLVSTIHQGF
jgi:hypothetical protein